MKIGVKHQKQESIVRADFSGGLNTSANVDGIAENQLSVAVNVEVDHTTGRLRTAAGTTDILFLENIFAALYDEINKKLLLVTSDKTAYVTDFKKTTPLGKYTFLRYVPPLSQLWAIKGQSVLMFDLVTQSWFRREFHSPVIDVIPVGNDVLIIKKDRVSKLNADSFTDLGEPLKWKWYCKRLVSQHDFLLKRVQISFTPYDWRNCEGQITVGKVVVPFPKFEGGSTSAPNSWKKFFLSEGRMIYGDEDLIIKNPQPIYSKPTIFTESRNVFRSKFLDIGGTGSKGGVVFNSVIMDLVEV